MLEKNNNQEFLVNKCSEWFINLKKLNNSTRCLIIIKAIINII
jgi:hypothetical protein